MAPFGAILLFPLCPGRSSDALCRWAALAAPAPPLLLFALLAARGCAVADAAVTAAGLFALIIGLGLGGAAASRFARRLLPGAPARGLHVHLVFAAWAVTLLLGVLLATGSALLSALALLVFGVGAGTRVLAAGTVQDPGRLVVASCAGVFGALIGLLLMGSAVHGWLVMAVPAPGPREGTVLVRRGEAAEEGGLILAVDPGSSTVFLARGGAGGLVPEGRGPPAPGGPYKPLGRVFFFFGVGNRLGSPPNE